ncbi:phage tail spike protein [Aerococcus viridans]|uniref:phage tail spike protein n=1 Tax=Aerococcus viridans TaxID=1377 RepID=UPI003B21FB28
MYQVMMYDGLNDTVGQVIHSHNSGGLKLIEGQINQNINEIDSFYFTYLPNNPIHTKIRPMITLIKVFNTLTGQYEFEGRVVTIEETLSENDLAFEVSCESELGFLHDSFQDFYEFRGTPKELLQRILNKHNKVVESTKNFTLGTVEITDPNDYYYVFLDQTETSWDAIQRTLIDTYNGELVMRKVGNNRYLDYVVQQGHRSDVTIALKKNLQSYSKLVDPTEIITRLKPLGATLEPEEHDENEPLGVKYPRLDIKSANNGLDYIDNQELIKAFGVQGGVEVFDDITTASALMKAGENFFKNQKLVLNQYNVTALDLFLIGKDIESFEVGNTHLLDDPVMNVHEWLRIIGKSVDINEPQNSSLTIGDKFKTATEMQLDLRKEIVRAKTLQQQLQTANQLLAGRLNTVSTMTGDLSSNYTNLTNVVLPDFEARIKTLEVPPTPPTDSNGYSTSRVFPVDYTLPGINFFVRSGKSPGSIEYDMTYGMRDGVLHSGQDIGTNGDRNYKAYATTDGVVRKAEFMTGGIGNAVYVEHTGDKYWSNYMHLKSISVSVGQTVKAGDVIGVIGGTGGDYAPHLHFEISPDGNFHSGGNTVNPQAYLGITGDNTTTLPRPV